MCDLCKQAELDIKAFKTGYGDKYTPKAIEQLNKLRNDLCTKKATCNCEECPAQKFIDIIDTDPDIQKKKGL